MNRRPLLIGILAAAVIALAVGMGVGTSLVGAYVSYFFDGSTGGCIVTLQSFLFVLALVFGPKHGLLAARSRRLAAATAEPQTQTGI